VPLRVILYIHRTSIRIVLFTILFATVVFFALTRTEVGRNGLRIELERRFDATFEGRLAIGQLNGNLVNTLYARDVRIFDPDGRIMLSVDSVIVSPDWKQLFTREISLGGLTLIRPRMNLLNDENGFWNVGRAFQKRNPDSTQSTPWAISSTDLRLSDGAIATANIGPLPEPIRRGDVFNFVEARIDSISLSATIDWQREVRQVDLIDLSASLVDPKYRLEKVQGQLIFDGTRLSVPQFWLNTGSSFVAMNGYVNQFDDFLRGFFDGVGIDLTLDQSRIDFGELRRLLPSLPVADEVRTSAHVYGPLSSLVVESLKMERGATRISGEGTLLGFPDSLDLEVAFRDNVIATPDLRTIFPEVAVLKAFNVDTLHADVFAKGVIHRDAADRQPQFDVSTELNLTSPFGNLSGNVNLKRENSAGLQYRGELVSDELNLGAVVQDETWRSALTGKLSFDGRGQTADSLNGAVHLRLGVSALAGRSIDSLSADFNINRMLVSGRLTGIVGGGSMQVEWGLDAANEMPTYQMITSLHRFDIGPLIRNDTMETRLNGRLVLSGRGYSDPNLQGKLSMELDSSTVRYGNINRTVLPQKMSLALAPRFGDGSRLSIDGDAGTLRILGDVPVSPILMLSTLWQSAFLSTVAHVMDKRYPPQPALAGGGSAPPSQVDMVNGDAQPPDLFERREQVRTAFAAAGVGREIILDVQTRLIRPELLIAFFPGAPEFRTDLQSHLRLVAGPDSMRASATIFGDSLRLGPVYADSLTIKLRAAADLNRPLERTLVASLDISADSAHFGQSLRIPKLRFSYLERHGTITMTTLKGGRLGPLRIGAGIDILPDRNRVTIDSLFAAFGHYAWTTPGRPAIDFYRSAVVVPDLLFQSRSPIQDENQQFRIRGKYSTEPSDTLYLDTRRVALREFTDFVDFKPHLGGLFNSRVALTGGGRSPKLTGNINVSALSLDQYILGDVDVESRFVPGRPDVNLRLELRPTVAPDTAFVYGTTLPAFVKENRLGIDGFFRLPRRSATGVVLDPGAWNLNMTVGRADLFFMKILIGALDHARGKAVGKGSISGTFGKPIFNAQLKISDGHFEVPDLDIQYAVDGDVRVDAKAIHIDRAHLVDPTGGEGVVSGPILFNDYKNFSFDLHGQFDRLQIIDVDRSDVLPFYGHIWASGEAQLTGPIYNAQLRTTNARTTPESEIFVPVEESRGASDESFIIFADSTGKLPNIQKRTRRSNVLASRPVGERRFLDGVDLNIDFFASPGSTIHLVIDPLLGDVINAVGTGRIQIQRTNGEFFTYGKLEVNSGDYLFTAGEVFVRRFLIEDGGDITWDGDPINAQLNIPASYRTRASRAGLPSFGGNSQSLIPLIVKLQISGRVVAPEVNLSLAIDQTQQNRLGDYQGIEAILNQPERSTEYATSVLLTNSFRLTTNNIGSGSGGQLAFTSVSQLVSSQLNRFLNQTLPNVDFTFGLQGENAQDLDVTYGVALRLLDEKLIIRGEGVYQGSRTSTSAANSGSQSLQGEFVVEVKLSPAVSVEVFYRREGDVLAENAALTNTTGAGLSYQTEFSTWGGFFHKVFGWITPDKKPDMEEPEDRVAGTTDN